MSVFLLFVITLLSLPVVSSLLYKSIELSSSYTITCPKDAVVILSGGYFDGEKIVSDELNGEAATRVTKGVEVFQSCNAKWLVLSGRPKLREKEMFGELMQSLALKTGVPQDRILLETDSFNTREHAIYLEKMGTFGPDSEIAVVSSPWHLRRAIIEFRRYFSSVAPIAAYYDNPMVEPYSIRDWLPQIQILELSTRILHEYIGMLWYAISNRVQA